MSGTARGRPSWRVGKLLERRSEIPTAATLVLDVADWPGHTAGQHVSVRLSMPDGSSPVRTFSIANAPGGGTRVELTVELLMNGAVSPYLVNAIAVGSTIDVLGPIGGWFVWRPEQTEPVQLIAGGSGVVPLMAMMRTRKSAGSRAPFRLLYSARSPEAVYYKSELSAFAAEAGAPDVTLAYTREVPPDFHLRRNGSTRNRSTPASFRQRSILQRTCAVPPRSWNRCRTCWRKPATMQRRSNSSDSNRRERLAELCLRAGPQ